MVAQLPDQVKRHEAGRALRQPPTPVGGIDHDAEEIGDPAPPTLNRETEAAGGPPSGSFRDLDDEPPMCVRLGGRGPERLPHLALLPGRDAGEERLGLGMSREIDQEADVLRPGSAQAKAPAGDRLRHGETGAGERRPIRATPDPNATPARMSARPRTAVPRIDSSRNAAP